MATQKTTVSAVIIGIVIVAALVWVGVQKDEQNPSNREASPEAVSEESEVIKIGWMGPLSGEAESYGQDIKRGVELALEELDSEGVEVVYADSRCEPEESVSVVNNLINEDRVQAIIGEVCSEATLATAQVAQRNSVVMISPASTLAEISEVGDFIYRTIPSDSLMGSFGAQLMLDDGHKTLAILFSNDVYGEELNKILGDTFERFGGEIVSSQQFEIESANFSSELVKIKAAKPDALFIINNSTESSVALLEQVQSLGVQASLYGSEVFGSAEVIKSAGVAAEDLKIVSISGGTSVFVANFKEKFGVTPGPFAAQGYDAMVALVRSIENGASTGPAIRDALQLIEFDGASGYIIFDSNGDVEANYDALVVEEGELVMAPQSSPTPDPEDVNSVVVERTPTTLPDPSPSQ